MKRSNGSALNNNLTHQGSKKNKVEESSPNFEDELMLMDDMICESVDIDDSLENQQSRWSRPQSEINPQTDNLGIAFFSANSCNIVSVVLYYT